ncbi:MAG: hypothetical protein GY816_11920, partial [Cytophagales bacterium]|nr:hypothetical protein [Cytophagales bacterium]
MKYPRFVLHKAKFDFLSASRMIEGNGYFAVNIPPPHNFEGNTNQDSFAGPPTFCQNAPPNPNFCSPTLPPVHHTIHPAIGPTPMEIHPAPFVDANINTTTAVPSVVGHLPSNVSYILEAHVLPGSLAPLIQHQMGVNHSGGNHLLWADERGSNRYLEGYNWVPQHPALLQGSYGFAPVFHAYGQRQASPYLPHHHTPWLPVSYLSPMGFPAVS